MAVTQIIKSVLFTRATFSKWEQRNIYNASGTVKDCCYHNISPIIASHSAEEFKYNEATKCKSLKIMNNCSCFSSVHWINSHCKPFLYDVMELFRSESLVALHCVHSFQFNVKMHCLTSDLPRPLNKCLHSCISNVACIIIGFLLGVLEY